MIIMLMFLRLWALTICCGGRQRMLIYCKLQSEASTQSSLAYYCIKIAILHYDGHMLIYCKLQRMLFKQTAHCPGTGGRHQNMQSDKLQHWTLSGGRTIWNWSKMHCTVLTRNVVHIKTTVYCAIYCAIYCLLFTIYCATLRCIWFCIGQGSDLELKGFEGSYR